MHKKLRSLILAILVIPVPSLSQKTDSAKNIYHFSGTILATNNGISLVPTFSLGDPAAIFNLSIGKEKFSFEPELRFALEGKPWSFLFWWRYRIRTGKFAMSIGGHPAMNFRTVVDTVNGVATEKILVRRFLAAELAPNYFLTKNISVGIYYLYSRGFDFASPKNGHFITFNAGFSNIRIAKQILIRVNPAVYYLKQDQQDGYFVTSTFNFSKRDFPLSLGSIVNKTLRSNVVGSKDFNWNVSVIYSFSKKFSRI